MKKTAVCIALAASLLGTTAQAALVEFERASVVVAPIAGLASGTDLMAAFAPGKSHLIADVSELPEPEVFAVMLLGLVLIGYRASRHSDEKFE